jgi:BP28CT (NUC211) domain
MFISHAIQIVDQTCLVAFTSLVMKLSEASFTPLFRRLQDWAWVSDAPQGRVGFQVLHGYNLTLDIQGSLAFVGGLSVEL